MIHYGNEIEAKLSGLTERIASDAAFTARYPARWMAIKLLEKDSNACEQLAGHASLEAVIAAARDAVAWIERHFGKDAEIIVTEQRYGYIRGAVQEAVEFSKTVDISLTQTIDRVIMNRFLTLPVFIAVLWSVFQLTFILGSYPAAALESGFNFLGSAFEQIIPGGIFRSLIVDGIIGGVGGVFSFVPLIVILFFLLSILEDVGYMSRAAFATDKLLHSFGLHGQSVFPMMLGFGCSVPAIMASRTLKSRRDRIITVLITPLMNCGAKLPVHVLLAAAFFPGHEVNMVMLIYISGVVLALLSALLLKRTALRGDPTPFVMELPPYRAPTFQGILWHVWEKTRQYIKKAGTVILSAAILIWAITSFPRYELSGAEQAGLRASYTKDHPLAGEAEQAAFLETSAAEYGLKHSFAGMLGRAIEPVFRPLGFDWKISVASVTGFAAKEIIVSTLGILYRIGSGENEESEGLRYALHNDPAMSPLSALSFMLFILIIPPCFAALATIRAELGWKWVGFELIFLFLLGWTVSFLVFQLGSLSG
jgi:ferrous iron transport protein B